MKVSRSRVSVCGFYHAWFWSASRLLTMRPHAQPSLIRQTSFLSYPASPPMSAHWWTFDSERAARQSDGVRATKNGQYFLTKTQFYHLNIISKFSAILLAPSRIAVWALVCLPFSELPNFLNARFPRTHTRRSDFHNLIKIAFSFRKTRLNYR